jgi:penicillin-binding protein 1A
MAQARIRRSTPLPAAPRSHRRRHRGLKTVGVFLGVLVLATFIGRAYVLNVYAPGLQAEASNVPAIVQSQVREHGGSYVPIGGIAPSMRQAIVSIEDRRFYHHPGIDPEAMVRAIFVNLTNRHIDQGGSTLEEQLAKRAIVHDDRSLHAKLRTMGLGWALDQDFSKQHILEMYLNAAYYGQGAYGIEAAARTYFGVDAANLSLVQSAFLAALPQAPSVYGAHPLAPSVTDRWHQVLIDMRAEGYITSAQEREALASRLVFALPNP